MVSATHSQSTRSISPPPERALPSTRYLGSKRKLLVPLRQVFDTLDFTSAADPFCGSGSVSWLLKSMNKTVFASDVLQWNVICTRAVLASQIAGFDALLDDALQKALASSRAAGFIETHFDGLFFTRDENRFLDNFLRIIADFPQEAKDAALYTLFQSALAKRPYNLFHRANLYMRQQNVKRSFGNKTTWDTPFDILMRRSAKELARAWFPCDAPVSVTQHDVARQDFSTVDLVYLDPPYVSQKKVGVDYLDYYHFLEGIAMADNQQWQAKMLSRYKHRPLLGKGESPWCDAGQIEAAFESVISRCKNSTLVISYRSDGIPTIEQLVAMLEGHQKKVRVADCGAYVYALSKNNHSREVIIVGE